MPTPNANTGGANGRRGTKPTARQLAYLRSLAIQRGMTFATPATVDEASAEIRRLKRHHRSSRADIRDDRESVARDMAMRRGDNAKVREFEVTGYGSGATWAQRG
jgi:hypothetical protein